MIVFRPIIDGDCWYNSKQTDFESLGECLEDVAYEFNKWQLSHGSTFSIGVDDLVIKYCNCGDRMRGWKDKFNVVFKPIVQILDTAGALKYFGIERAYSKEPGILGCFTTCVEENDEIGEMKE